MSDDDQIGNLVSQAKDAVSGLEEPYRMEAFKIVLDRLLSGAVDTRVSVRDKNANKGKTRTSRKGAKKKPNKTTPRKSEVETSLDLTTEQLKSLKEFYQNHKPAGGELCAFILSIYLHEILSMQQFNEADVEYLYRSLISMKVKVPAVSNWRREMGWLCAKSRKKEWLKRDGTNYEVTNAGLIAFNEIDEKAQK
jgi:hypothetical protein